MNRQGPLEIEVILRFKTDDGPEKRENHRFWVLIPNKMLYRYRQSYYEFLKDLLSSYSAKHIRKLQQIGTCQFVHRESEGIEWLFRQNGTLYLWVDPRRVTVSAWSWIFMKLKNRLVDHLESGSVDTSSAFTRYHVRDAKFECSLYSRFEVGCDGQCSARLNGAEAIARFKSSIHAPRRHIAFAQAVDLYLECYSAQKLDVDRKSEILDLIGLCIRSAMGPSSQSTLDFEWIYHSTLFTHDKHWLTISVLILWKNKETAPIWWERYDGSNRRCGYQGWCTWILSDLFHALGLLKKAKKYMLRLKAMKTESEWKKIMDTPSRNGRYLLDIDRQIDLLQCEVCGVKGSINNGCSGCNRVFYCGKRCQKRDWMRGHRMECGRELGKIKGVPQETFNGWYQTIRLVEKGEVIRSDGRFKKKIIKMVQDILKWSIIKERYVIEFERSKNY